MSWFDRIGRLFKTIVTMDQKITQLVDVVKRLDAENRQLRERVAKLEALAQRRDAKGKKNDG
jgi:regulator of replication initiation timing